MNVHERQKKVCYESYLCRADMSAKWALRANRFYPDIIIPASETCVSLSQIRFHSVTGSLFICLLTMAHTPLPAPNFTLLIFRWRGGDFPAQKQLLFQRASTTTKYVNILVTCFRAAKIKNLVLLWPLLPSMVSQGFCDILTHSHSFDLLL